MIFVCEQTSKLLERFLSLLKKLGIKSAKSDEPPSDMYPINPS